MQARQFCYWLQGSFELNETTEFDESSTQTLKDHLSLVFQHDPKPNGFCCFLNGYFTLGNPRTIDQTTTAQIREKLSNTFKYEIDPSYPPSEQKTLNKIHNGSEAPRFEKMC